MEYVRKCEVCGKIYCYTDDDLKKSKANSFNKTVSAIGTIASVLGGGNMLTSAYLDNQTQKYGDKVVDYTKCPNCNSTKTHLVEDVVVNNNHNNNQVTFSENRERDILKKKWLDQGLIDKEDYDTMTDEQFDMLKEEFELLDKEFDDFF